MALFLTILVWGLVAVLAAVIALLVTPIWLRLRLTKSPDFAYSCDVRVFGGVAPPITLASSARKRVKKEPEKKPAKPKKRAARRAFDGRRMIRAAPRLIGDILRQIHFAALKVDCEFGLDDPADTGQLAGVLLPISYAAPVSPANRISLRPNFERRCLEGEISAAVRLTVAAFVPPVVRFAWRAFGPVR